MESRAVRCSLRAVFFDVNMIQYAFLTNIQSPTTSCWRCFALSERCCLSLVSRVAGHQSPDRRLLQRRGPCPGNGLPHLGSREGGRAIKRPPFPQTLPGQGSVPRTLNDRHFVRVFCPWALTASAFCKWPNPMRTYHGCFLWDLMRSVMVLLLTFFAWMPGPLSWLYHWQHRWIAPQRSG